MVTPTLTSRLPAMILELPGAVNDALKESAEAIAGGAQQRVPVDTGALRDAIHVEEIDDGYAVVAGDTEAYYGHIIEHGGVKTPARPFLTPAMEAERANHLKRVADALEDL